MYRNLQPLYRGFPKEMFVNRSLLNEASCEVKLGEIQSKSFKQIKESDDFSYSLQSMLELKVFTRTGDAVAVKLALDMHRLMSLLEGADYSDLREC